MDPNVTLAEIRRELADLDAARDEFPDGNLLVELFEALDAWLRKGGFLPDDWDRPLPTQQILVTLPDRQQVGFMHGSIHHRHSPGSTWSSPVSEVLAGKNPHTPNTYHIGEW